MKKDSAASAAKYQERKTFDVRFAVIGTGHFPLDMLRYDACWPATPVDVARMIEHDNPVARRVDLYSAPSTLIENPGPTRARWESFGWRVVEDRA